MTLDYFLMCARPGKYRKMVELIIIIEENMTIYWGMNVVMLQQSFDLSCVEAWDARQSHYPSVWI